MCLNVLSPCFKLPSMGVTHHCLVASSAVRSLPCLGLTSPRFCCVLLAYFTIRSEKIQTKTHSRRKTSLSDDVHALLSIVTAHGMLVPAHRQNNRRTGLLVSHVQNWHPNKITYVKFNIIFRSYVAVWSRMLLAYFTIRSEKIQTKTHSRRKASLSDDILLIVIVQVILVPAHRQNNRRTGLNYNTNTALVKNVTAKHNKQPMD